ncbi:MAG: heavy metal translocating P-type ATPase metal-binding domain-containing protein, partial [Usitatibacteraceae bacterium]
MNTLVEDALRAKVATGSRVEETAECFHCGLPVNTGTQFQIRFDGKSRALCCAGCEAVARTILDAGLDAYYTGRTANALTPASLPAVDALFDLNSIQSSYVSSPDAVTRSADLYIDGITCSACVWLAESALLRVPGVTGATVNQITHRACVTWDAGTTSLRPLMDALSRVGLGAQPASASERFALRRRARRRALFELGVAMLGMMQVMMFTVPLYFSTTDDVSPEARLLMGWAGLVLTLPVLLFSARSFFIGAWRDLLARRVNMDLPIALAIIATFTTSAASLFRGGNDLYFDSISMFVFLLLAARYLESNARESSLSLIERLTNAVPAVAWRVAGFPAQREAVRVAAAELRAGDVIRVATGEAVAADGVIVEGVSEFDDSLLTGESIPVKRAQHAPLISGSLNTGSPVLVRITRTGEATTAAILARLTEQALSTRPRLTQLAERLARWIAPVTLALAFAAAAAWWLIDPSRSFAIAVAVLAVTCPCALALAAPAAQALAITRLAREGLLITRAETLERIANATDIAFDKTGTLTEGAVVVERVHLLGTADEQDILTCSVALEAGSPHPVARALAHRLALNPTALPSVRRATLVPGDGVEGEIDGALIRLGHIAFVERLVGAPAPLVNRAASLFMGREGQWLAEFELSDPVKADAHVTLRALEADSLTPHLLSGDRKDRVDAVALNLAIDQRHVCSSQSPAGKLA